jgi:hypothetical protein
MGTAGSGQASRWRCCQPARLCARLLCPRQWADHDREKRAATPHLNPFLRWVGFHGTGYDLQTPVVGRRSLTRHRGCVGAKADVEQCTATPLKHCRTPRVRRDRGDHRWERASTDGSLLPRACRNVCSKGDGEEDATAPLLHCRPAFMLGHRAHGDGQHVEFERLLLACACVSVRALQGWGMNGRSQ